MKAPISPLGALKGAALAALLALSAPAAHAAETPFGGLNGSWSGGGTLKLTDGGKESMRCRGVYNVDRGGHNMTIMLRCASDSYRFELQSTITHANGQVSGQWKELSRNVSGTISGTGAPGRINATADAGLFAAKLALSTRADKQSVSIVTPVGPVAEVAISLSRGK